MPIKSYLALAKEGRKESLHRALLQMPECDVVPSENKNLLVIITEVVDEAKDQKLFKEINSLEDLQLLTLVSAFSNQPESTPK